MLRAGLLIALLLPVAGIAQQTAAVSNGAQPHVLAAAPAESIQLGDSVVELTGPWKFHTGDDPSWAQPGFDDSGWAAMDLTPPADPDDPTQTGPIPGWTARGYPNYSGYAWYRVRVNVQGATHRLSLKMPDSVDDAYQVFVNGEKIGQFGRFDAHRVTAFGTLPRAFALPRNIRNGPISIAIRLWMDSATPFNSPDAGGLHGPPLLGYAPDIAGQVRLNYDDIAHFVGSGFLETLILFMALLMAATLYWLDPHEDAYLWLALVCIATLLGNAIVLLANFTTPMGQTEGVIITDVISTPVRIGCWVMFWAYWFHLPRLGRMHAIVWSLVGLLALGTALLRPPLYGQHVPVHASGVLVPVLLVLKLGLGVLLGYIAIFGFRRRRAEGGMAGAAVMLAFAANFQHELRLIHIDIHTSVFGFAVSLGTVSTILSLLIITVMLLRRFIHSQRQQEQWKLEIEQARSVQQVLIPDELPRVKGLRVRSEYHPAREVGGDFFQILPLDEDGTAIIVIGDVTGKGLQAGMLVALVVGAIRTALTQTTDPGKILSIVNEQLAERAHASATCAVLRLESDGALTIAHAGHLPPYLNGEELELEGALPAGMLSGASFPAETYQLHPGDELTLMSDGVVEAQDSHGRLFGFERVNEMMAAHATAEEIAAAARKFGQADDITVLQLQWQGRVAAVFVGSEPQLAAQ
ncbi:MAG TPA: SpoIIE family protein phosphatase [Acidobacteriaceae bacterium]|nr:SpoIIE family protein phosphatase [Acidobacteriaceae bacterium]